MNGLTLLGIVLALFSVAVAAIMRGDIDERDKQYRDARDTTNRDDSGESPRF